MIILAALVLAAQPAPAARPDFTTAPVTPPMAVAAIDECARQLRAGAFDHARLTGAGWVSFVHSDGGDPDIRGYRHPDNMIMMQMIDHANAPDRCVVMAPTEMGLSFDSMRSALREHLGARPAQRGNEIVWELADLRIALRPMTAPGIIVELDPRSNDVDSRRR